MNQMTLFNYCESLIEGEMTKELVTQLVNVPLNFELVFVAALEVCGVANWGLNEVQLRS